MVDLCHDEPPNTWGPGTAERRSQIALTTTTKKKHHHHPSIKAGYWGPEPYSECDSPIQLVNATFEFLQRRILKDDIDFVVWTGDNARHDNDNRYPRTLKQIYASNKFLVDKMQDTFGRNKYSKKFIPVIPTMGNNDVYPHNIMFAGPNSKIINEFRQMWRTWVPPEQLHTFDRGGYFHVPVKEKLSVLSLNSLYFYENNKAVDDCSAHDEPGALQLEWLAIQLKIFRQQQRRVWIIGHVPPTDRQWYSVCYSRYANLMIEYRDLVVGQLFGHLNIDHFYTMQYIPDASSADSSTRRALKNTPEHVLAKSPLDLMRDIREGFDKLPDFISKKAKSASRRQRMIEHYAVVNVAPSVVPNYYPSFRVYDYITGLDSNTGAASDTKAKKKKQKGRKKGKHRSNRLPALPPSASLGPAYVRQLYSPIKYAQYYMNTTEANVGRNESIDYLIEYDTSLAPYNMTDLTTENWLILANKVSGLRVHDDCSPDMTVHAATAACSMRQTTWMQSLWNDWLKDIDLLGMMSSKKKKKHKPRYEGFWEVFLRRAFVSTGYEFVES